MARSLLIVGLGNRLMSDDGTGLRIAETLQDKELPEGVRVEIAGGDVLRVAGLWRGEKEIWLLDAVQGGGRPGTLVLLEHEEILALPQRHAGAHHLSLPESLRWLAASRPGMDRVRFRLWGIVPERLEPGEGVSPGLDLSIIESLRRIEKELGLEDRPLVE
jgi:hydrogenase maturation protease